MMCVAFIFPATLAFPPGCHVNKVNAQEVVPSRGVPVAVVSDEVLAEVRNILFPLDVLQGAWSDISFGASLHAGFQV